MNGPDDFNFVVDRAFSPGKGRKLRFTKEWVAYVDDLTVRTGRVIDGRFMTDAEAEREIRQACAKGALAVPQGAGSALEALGVNTNLRGTGKTKHDEATSDHNRPTRSCGLAGLGDGQVGLAGVCSVVVVAALVAAPVVLMPTRLFLARKVFMLTVFMLLSMLSLQLSRSAVHVLEFEHKSWQSHVLPALNTASDLCVPQRQRARDSGPQCSLVPFNVRSGVCDSLSHSRRGEHPTQLSYKCAQPTRCRAGLCVSPVPPATATASWSAVTRRTLRRHLSKHSGMAPSASEATSKLAGGSACQGCVTILLKRPSGPSRAIVRTAA